MSGLEASPIRKFISRKFISTQFISTPTTALETVGVGSRRRADIRQQSGRAGIGLRVPGFRAEIARQGKIKRSPYRPFARFGRSQSGGKKSAQQQGKNYAFHEYSRFNSEFASVMTSAILVLLCSRSFTNR
jgi:hypothetical protein